MDPALVVALACGIGIMLLYRRALRRSRSTAPRCVDCQVDMEPAFGDSHRTILRRFYRVSYFRCPNCLRAAPAHQWR
jgi:hypothetical protein